MNFIEKYNSGTSIETIQNTLRLSEELSSNELLVTGLMMSKHLAEISGGEIQDNEYVSLNVFGAHDWWVYRKYSEANDGNVVSVSYNWIKSEVLESIFGFIPEYERFIVNGSIV